MKSVIWYVCPRCIYKSKQQTKCIKCKIALEKLCMKCNNAKTKCYCVKCPIAKKK